MLLQAVDTVLERLNADTPERGQSIEYHDLYYVYVNEDPRHGLTYILDLSLVYKKFNESGGMATTEEVRKHVFVRQLPLRDTTWVKTFPPKHFITPSGEVVRVLFCFCLYLL
jgi:hypothetical protein